MGKKFKDSTSLPIDVFREGEAFIAYCPVLDLPAAGKSYEAAIEKFEAVAQAFFEELIRAGTLDDYLGEMGWTKSLGRWVPPVLVAHSEKAFALPLHR